MSDTSTRSGMLWEFERILMASPVKPDMLLMENVPQVHGADNVKDFNKWQLALEKIGYKNYWQDLNAKDYGIPQNRNRCFMVSVLGDYSYTFPDKQKLTLRLKDMLESDVDEKYYLSEKQLNDISQWNSQQKPLEHINDDPVGTLTTRDGAYTSSMKLVSMSLKHQLCNELINNGKVKEGDVIRHSYTNNRMNKMYTQNQVDKNCPPTLDTRCDCFGITVKNATKQGYLLAEDGDGIDISGRMEYHRGTVQKGMTQTISTMGGDNNGVVVETYQYAKSDNFMRSKDRLQLGKNVADCIQASQKEGVVIKENCIQWYEKGKHDLDCRAYFVDKVAPTTTTPKSKVLCDLHIRKLTPRECFRLMGLKDNEIDLISGSDANKYHLAGDSIVVNVLEKIFKEVI